VTVKSVDRHSDQLARRALAVCTAVVALYLLFATGQRALDAYQANRQTENLRGEIAALRERNLALQGQLASPRLDEEIERTAREELGYIRSGDHPVTLIWPAGQPPIQQTVAARETDDEPHWRAWMRLLTGGERAP
jgi:cell division protein FtsB